MKEKVHSLIEEKPKMLNLSTSESILKVFQPPRECLFNAAKAEKKNEALLTAFLFKPTLGVQWLPEDVKFSRTSSPLIIEVNIHTFGRNIVFIFYFYDIILSLISINNDILD